MSPSSRRDSKKPNSRPPRRRGGRRPKQNRGVGYGGQQWFALSRAGQAVCRSVPPEADRTGSRSRLPAFGPFRRLGGHPSEPGPYVIRVKVPAGVSNDAAQTPGGPSLHGYVRWRFLHRPRRSVRRRSCEGLSARAASSFCRAIRPTSIGRRRASTSPRSPPSVHWGSTTWILADDPRQQNRQDAAS